MMAAWTAAGVAGRDAGGQVRACEECAEARQDYSASAVCILCITDAKWASRAAISSFGLNITNSVPASAFGECPGVM